MVTQEWPLVPITYDNWWTYSRLDCYPLAALNLGHQVSAGLGHWRLVRPRLLPATSLNHMIRSQPTVRFPIAQLNLQGRMGNAKLATQIAVHLSDKPIAGMTRGHH